MGCSAVRPKIGHDTSISRNFICPSPEDLAAHRRLSRKSPWPALSSSLLNDCPDIKSEVMGTRSACVQRPKPLGAFVPTLSPCTHLLLKCFLPSKAFRSYMEGLVLCDDC